MCDYMSSVAIVMVVHKSHQTTGKKARSRDESKSSLKPKEAGRGAFSGYYRERENKADDTTICRKQKVGCNSEDSSEMAVVSPCCLRGGLPL